MSGKYRRRISTKSRGFGILSWVLMVPVGIIVLLILAISFYEGSKAYWNSKVREMCEKDGGVRVYERVDLSEDEYKKLGGIKGVVPIPDERSTNKTSPYFAKSSTAEINSGSPWVTRRETIIVRRADEKVLGRLVIYSRVGGDIPISFGHPTYFSCQNIPEIRLDIERQVFAIKGASK